MGEIDALRDAIGRLTAENER